MEKVRKIKVIHLSKACCQYEWSTQAFINNCDNGWVFSWVEGQWWLYLSKPSLIFFVFSDNLSAENSKLSADVYIKQMHFLNVCEGWDQNISEQCVKILDFDGTFILLNSFRLKWCLKSKSFDPHLIVVCIWYAGMVCPANVKSEPKSQILNNYADLIWICHIQTQTQTHTQTNLAMVGKIPNWPGVERGIMLVKATPASTPIPSTFHNMYHHICGKRYILSLFDISVECLLSTLTIYCCF